MGCDLDVVRLLSGDFQDFPVISGNFWKKSGYFREFPGVSGNFQAFAGATPGPRWGHVGAGPGHTQHGQITNTQKHVDKYTKTFGQIHKHIWKHTQKHLETYTKIFGNIHKNIWKHTQKHLEAYLQTFGHIHKNRLSNTQTQLDKYTNTCKKWTAVGDYELILWEIEAMHYILLLGMPKPF